MRCRSCVQSRDEGVGRVRGDVSGKVNEGDEPEGTGAEECCRPEEERQERGAEGIEK